MAIEVKESEFLYIALLVLSNGVISIECSGKKLKSILDTIKRLKELGVVDYKKLEYRLVSNIMREKWWEVIAEDVKLKRIKTHYKSKEKKIIISYEC